MIDLFTCTAASPCTVTSCRHEPAAVNCQLRNNPAVSAHEINVAGNVLTWRLLMADFITWGPFFFFFVPPYIPRCRQMAQLGNNVR